MKHLIVIFAALAMGAVTAHAQEEETQEFVKKAAVSNKFEVASSELALERAQNPAVRQFAEHMIRDHRKAGKELQTAVEKTELAVGMPDTLDDKHAEMMQELGDASGAEFDRKYVQMQTAAHDEAVSLFENYVENDEASADVRQFAEKTLPVLKEHDRQAQQLSQRVADL